MARGRFITLEGGEGAGKSTLAQALAAALTASGRDVLATREPGGAPGAEAIRALLLEGATDRWSAGEEALLLSAARLNHLTTTIRPALARGAWVVCDRYIDSTLAYQGAAGGLDAAKIAQLNAYIDADVPDLTFVLDIDPEHGLARGARVGRDRFERMGSAFHRSVRDAFLAIARREPERCAVLDASQPKEIVLETSLKELALRL